jgi:iron complex transport system ATP-binding protein
MDAGAGELVGIVGPNGAGKTTLLRLISGVLRPSQGRIVVQGTDLASLKARERATLVAVVPQSPQLPSGLRVIDLVLMGRNPHLGLLEWESRHDLEVARLVMEQTDIGRLADRPIGRLSGGERQRVLIALALAQEAPVLLLDEPTASLDLSHQAAIMDLVKSVQRQRGGCVVLSMHDLTLAAQYCDRLVMLSRGRSYLQGPPRSVLTQEAILSVYGAQVHILPHPQGGTPVVLPLPRRPVAGDGGLPSGPPTVEEQQA